MENRTISQLLKNVAVSYEISGESPFRIRAYRQAADSIENYPTDIRLVWKQGNLQKIPGVGGSIAQHLDEYFVKGESEYFNTILSKMPQGMYDLMKIRGVGPKTAFTLSRMLNSNKYNQKQDIYARLKKAIDDNEIAPLEGFGQKSQEDIASSLESYKAGIRKKKRLLIDEAEAIVTKFTNFVQSKNNVSNIEVLGSYRRKKETIGDLDIALITTDKSATIEHIKFYPDIKEIVDEGEQGMTLLLVDGTQIDIRFATKSSWGAMIQYFTGSKYHNIALREYALKKQLSLNEHGIKNLHDKNKPLETFASEKAFYKRIGLDLIPPELREDRGEIQASDTLPNLISTEDIKGDLHIHPKIDYPSSHDIGQSTIEELINKAEEKGYDYIALADHNPKKGLTDKEVLEIINNRNKELEKCLNKKSVQKNSNKINVYKMMEVDIQPDGKLSLSYTAAEQLDGIIVSIHSSFAQDTETTTKRILTALSHKKVRVFGHPTGRLINKREQIKADWETIFSFCKKQDIALEINASPTRLDLPDGLVKQAKDIGCKFVIDTDAHHKDQMDYIHYGVFVARRGWLEKGDILNTLTKNEFNKWLLKK